MAVKSALINFKKYGLVNISNINSLKERLEKENINLLLPDLGRTIVISVLGAGRGPLVRKAVEACNEMKVKYKVLVLEKNKNAFNTLLYLKINEPDVFDDKVEFAFGDMRTKAVIA